MKKLQIILLVYSTALWAQRHDGNFSIDAKMKKAPWSFLWHEEGKLAVKQAEVSLDEYLYFLEEVSKDSSGACVEKLIPAPECALSPFVEKEQIGLEFAGRKISWIDEEQLSSTLAIPSKEKRQGFSEIVFNPYFRPVTGISFAQAKAYAGWCTLKFNSEAKKKNKNLNQVTVFRLPTPAEFSEIEKKHLSSCPLKNAAECGKKIQQLKNCSNEKKCALCNCAEKDTCAINLKATEMFGENTPYYVYGYNPGWTGLYNIMGNVAELTSEEGIAKGGSYLQKAKDCQPESVQNYSKPEKWLGIRLVAEVKNADGKLVYFDQNDLPHWK